MFSQYALSKLYNKQFVSWKKINFLKILIVGNRLGCSSSFFHDSCSHFVFICIHVACWNATQCNCVLNWLSESQRHGKHSVAYKQWCNEANCTYKTFLITQSEFINAVLCFKKTVIF